MNISMIDASNYFKGLLVLIARDRIVTEPEMDLMRRIGKSLGFEKRFCQNAINDILDNSYVDRTPPVFPNKALAMMFIKDGLTVSYSDHDIHPFEDEWLREAAEKNGIDAQWMQEQKAAAAKRQGLPEPLEADSLTLEYT
jgi:hypothetical protein